MTSNVFRVKVSTIRGWKFFSITANEGTNVSTIEQLSFCVRSVDDNLDVSEDFIGFYKLDKMKKKIIVNAIKDILLRCHLNLDDCLGQTYNGASNMMGKRWSLLTNPC